MLLLTTHPSQAEVFKEVSDESLSQLATAYRYIGYLEATCKFHSEGFLPTKTAKANVFAAWVVSEKKGLVRQQMFNEFLSNNPDCEDLMPDTYLQGDK